MLKIDFAKAYTRHPSEYFNTKREAKNLTSVFTVIYIRYLLLQVLRFEFLFYNGSLSDNNKQKNDAEKKLIVVIFSLSIHHIYENKFLSLPDRFAMLFLRKVFYSVSLRTFKESDYFKIKYIQKYKIWKTFKLKLVKVIFVTKFD